MMFINVFVGLCRWDHFHESYVRDEVLLLFKQAQLSSSQKSHTPTISARYSYSRSHIMYSISNNYLVSMKSSTKSDNDKTFFSSLTDRTYNSIMIVSHSFVILLYWPSSSLNWLCNCIPLDFRVTLYTVMIVIDENWCQLWDVNESLDWGNWISTSKYLIKLLIFEWNQGSREIL